MTSINVNNYEAFLLDYFEGNLSEQAMEELNIFVLTHPELKIDLDKNDLPNLMSNETPIASGDLLSGKEQLLKTEDDYFLNNTAIAYFENLLNESESNVFRTELLHDEALQNEFRLISKSKLIADLSIVYTDKKALKKQPKIITLFNTRVISRMAAALLLLLGFAFFYSIYTNHVSRTISLTANKSIPVNLKQDLKITGVQNEEHNNIVAVKASGKLLNKNNSNISSQRSVDTTYKSNTIIFGSIADNVNEPVFSAAKQDSITAAKVAVANIAEQPAVKEGVLKYTNINALAVSTDNEDEIKPVKQNFWKRAVKLAQQANGLGLKAIKGDEKENENYSLSLNSFSIEKK